MLKLLKGLSTNFPSFICAKNILNVRLQIQFEALDFYNMAGAN